MNCTSFYYYEKKGKKLFPFQDKSVIIYEIMGCYAHNSCSFI